MLLSKRLNNDFTNFILLEQLQASLALAAAYTLEEVSLA